MEMDHVRLGLPRRLLDISITVAPEPAEHLDTLDGERHPHERQLLIEAQCRLPGRIQHLRAQRGRLGRVVGRGLEMGQRFAVADPQFLQQLEARTILDPTRAERAVDFFRIQPSATTRLDWGPIEMRNQQGMGRIAQKEFPRAMAAPILAVAHYLKAASRRCL